MIRYNIHKTTDHSIVEHFLTVNITARNNLNNNVLYVFFHDFGLGDNRT
jgi:hypothetical protein